MNGASLSRFMHHEKCIMKSPSHPNFEQKKMEICEAWCGFVKRTLEDTTNGVQLADLGRPPWAPALGLYTTTAFHSI